jgi:hypothetical protein
MARILQVARSRFAVAVRRERLGFGVRGSGCLGVRQGHFCNFWLERAFLKKFLLLVKKKLLVHSEICNYLAFNKFCRIRALRVTTL